MPSSVHFATELWRYPDLPLDILIEIASYVYPLDLVHLSQTSKALRGLFMSRSGRTTWRIVLGNVPELPPCPGDMCEPLYAALVFGQYCFGCGAKEAFWADYALRLRTCEPCYKANVTEGTEVFKALPRASRDMICDVVLMLVPSANVFDFANLDSSFDRINPLYHLKEDFYFKPELEAMLRLLWPLPAPEDIAELNQLMKTRANYVMMRQMHAVLIHAWDNYCATPASGPDFFRIKELFRHVESLQVFGCDWDEVCAPENPVFAGYLRGKGPEGRRSASASTNTVPPTALAENTHTPSRLHRDPPKSHTQLAAERLSLEQRGLDGREARVRGRFAQVAEWHQALLQTHPDLTAMDPARLPNAHDESKLWEPLMRDGDGRGPFGAGTIMDEQFAGPFIVNRLLGYERRVMRSLAGALDRWEWRRAEEEGRRRPRPGRGWRKEELRRRRNGRGTQGEPWMEDWLAHQEEILLRPTSFFMCAECGKHPYAYPDINVHWQNEHRGTSVWMDVGTWGESQGEYKAEVWEEGAEVAEKILAVLMKKGLPRDDRDMERLDELVEEGRVFCACGDPTMSTSEEDLSWVALVDHVFIHLNDDTLRTNTGVRSSNDAGDDDAPVWLNDHDLASCIRYLPEGADTSEATRRITADDSTRERINALLNQCSGTLLPACRLCDALTPDNKKDDSLFLTESADAVVYHMQAKHGKRVEEKDIVFWDSRVFNKS
ncbi:hypothetical protein LXA43DRAFT_1183460 [Ganoderma leucocontextum]|nr:hypothetical protein LXA43DRAFT_1183460 [Ganoderma leucocontextum]